MVISFKFSDSLYMHSPNSPWQRQDQSISKSTSINKPVSLQFQHQAHIEEAARGNLCSLHICHLPFLYFNTAFQLAAMDLEEHHLIEAERLKSVSLRNT